MRTVVHKALDFAKKLIEQDDADAALAFLKQLLWDLRIAQEVRDIGRLAAVWSNRMGLKEGESDQLHLEYLPGVIVRAEALLLLARESALANEKKQQEAKGFEGDRELLSSSEDLWETATDDPTARTFNELVKMGLSQEEALLSCELWSTYLDDLLKQMRILTAAIGRFLEKFLKRQNDKDFLADLALLEEDEKALNRDRSFWAMREYAAVKQAVEDYVGEELQAKGYPREKIARAQEMFRKKIIREENL